MRGSIGERGFRPFFLLGGLYAAAFTWLWVGVLWGWLAPPTWLGATRWHAHEMLFGFAAAAIAGFLLTAVPAWTGRPACTGKPLLGLAGLWVAGRVAMATAGHAPPLAIALVDGAFLPALAAIVAAPILRARSRRNYGVPLLLLGLATANACVHADAIGALPGASAPALRASLFAIAALVTLIGGRITPTFTVNALVRAGRPTAPIAPGLADRVALPAVGLFAVLDLAGAGPLASGAAAAVAALALAARLARWQTWRVLGDPLVWSLHLGYAWLPVAFALFALANLTGAVSPLAAVHALGAGAIGTMILAVASRVALGHTGRALVAPPSAVAAYALVTAGAVLRVGSAIAGGAATAQGIPISGALWAAAFAVFVAGYGGILLGPRVDAAASR